MKLYLYLQCKSVERTWSISSKNCKILGGGDDNISILDRPRVFYHPPHLPEAVPFLILRQRCS